jgi:signal transduction histidine kinase
MGADPTKVGEPAVGETAEDGALASLDRLGRRFLPTRALEDADVRSRAVILLGCAVMAIAIGAVMTLVTAAARDRPGETIASASIALSGVLTLLAVRGGRSVKGASVGFLSAVTVLLAASAWFAGGLRSAALTWLGTIPMIGYVLLGRTFARLSALAGVAIVLAFFALGQEAQLPLSYEPAVVVAFARVSVIAFLAAYSVISGAARERAIRESSRALRELRAKELALSRALSQVQRAQAAREAAEAELRLAQKLESVGRLAAGVAHEINTPVQFASDSVRFLASALTDLCNVVEAQRAALATCRSGSGPDEPSLARLAEVEAEADVEDLFDALPKAAERAAEGLGRVAEIVRAMKDFANPDGPAMAPADLNRGLLSTLTVAASEYEHVAGVETHLAELPLVTCNIGEINHAVLSLVVNAAHAIQDAKKPVGVRGHIVVRSWAEGHRVFVSVEDDGTGIPDDVCEKMFDPFFTTKEMGRGSGQGLALVRSTVLRHGGTIALETRVGRGTIVTLRLPVDGVGTPDDPSSQVAAPRAFPAAAGRGVSGPDLGRPPG